MKKWIALLLAVCMVLSFAACSSPADTPAATTEDPAPAQTAPAAKTHRQFLSTYISFIDKRK